MSVGIGHLQCGCDARTVNPKRTCGGLSPGAGVAQGARAHRDKTCAACACAEVARCTVLDIGHRQHARPDICATSKCVGTRKGQHAGAKLVQLWRAAALADHARDGDVAAHRGADGGCGRHCDSTCDRSGPIAAVEQGTTFEQGST